VDQPVDTELAKQILNEQHQNAHLLGGSVPQCNIDDVDHNNRQYSQKPAEEKTESANQQYIIDSLSKLESQAQNEHLSNLELTTQEESGLQDPEYQNKFNKRTVEIFEQT